MLTSEDLIKWAGRDGIVKGRLEVIHKWGISEPEREILLLVGLPKMVEPFFEAAIQEQEWPAIASKSHGALYKVGWDLGNDIAVGGDASGVFTIDPERGESDAFVNSTLDHLARFLHETGKAHHEFSWMTDDEIELAVSDLMAKLQSIDPPAFADTGCWWSMVFEQMDAGLL